MGKAKIINRGSGGGKAPIDFEYSGTYNIAYDTEYVDDKPYMTFVLKLLTSGILNIKSLTTPIVDAFLVGGGGRGYQGTRDGGPGGAGGAGGHVNLQQDISIVLNTAHETLIGAGGVWVYDPTATAGGGETSIFGYSAAGGTNGWGSLGGSGGSGGGGAGTSTGGAGGSNGANGTAGSGTAGSGEGISTEFMGYKYAGGGGGGGGSGAGGGAGGADCGGNGGVGGYAGHGAAGIANTGGGGGGGGGASNYNTGNGGLGGSGIVILRGRYA